MRGDSAPDAYDFDVRYLSQLLKDVLETAVREHHRIATRENDVANLGVLTDVLERRVVLVERDLFGVANLAAASAEAAVGRTDGADEEQRAIRVAVRDVRHR